MVDRNDTTIVVARSDDYDFYFETLDENGNYTDMSGVTYGFTVRKKIPGTDISSDDDEDVLIKKTFQGSPTGKNMFRIESELNNLNVGSYWYDFVKLYPLKKTLMFGNYVISSQITRRTSNDS